MAKGIWKFHKIIGLSLDLTPLTLWDSLIYSHYRYLRGNPYPKGPRAQIMGFKGQNTITFMVFET